MELIDKRWGKPYSQGGPFARIEATRVTDTWGLGADLSISAARWFGISVDVEFRIGPVFGAVSAGHLVPDDPADPVGPALAELLSGTEGLCEVDQPDEGGASRHAATSGEQKPQRWAVGD